MFHLCYTTLAFTGYLSSYQGCIEKAVSPGLQFQVESDAILQAVCLIFSPKSYSILLYNSRKRVQNQLSLHVYFAIELTPLSRCASTTLKTQPLKYHTL